MQFVAVAALSALAAGCASYPPPSARVAAQRQALMACRFEQTGRGDRLLKSSRSNPAVAACLARKGA